MKFALVVFTVVTGVIPMLFLATCLLTSSCPPEAFPDLSDNANMVSPYDNR